jgi:hypothetical protein
MMQKSTPDPKVLMQMFEERSDVGGTVPPDTAQHLATVAEEAWKDAQPRRPAKPGEGNGTTIDAVATAETLVALPLGRSDKNALRVGSSLRAQETSGQGSSGNSDTNLPHPTARPDWMRFAPHEKRFTSVRFSPELTETLRYLAYQTRQSKTDLMIEALIDLAAKYRAQGLDLPAFHRDGSLA